MQVSGVDSVFSFYMQPSGNREQVCPTCGVAACTCNTVQSSKGNEKAESKPNEAKAPDGSTLTEEEKRQVAELKKTDRKVRAHEQAHMAAGAGIVRGGATYQFTQGPDGKRYATAGEVSIDTSEGKTPEETIRKMQRVRAAALAPADPSATDQQVAAQAAAKAAKAQSELAKENREEKQTQMEKGGLLDITA